MSTSTLEPRNGFPFYLLFVASIFCTIGISNRCGANPSGALQAETTEDGIRVTIGEEHFTTYVNERYRNGFKYPFFYPINGPASGDSIVTYNQNPYSHHSGLFMSFDHVKSSGIDRGNYWGPQKHLDSGRVYSNPEILVSNKGKVVLKDETTWRVADQGTQLKDTRKITITVPSPDVRVLDFRFQFKPQQDLTLGKTGHGIFAARMHPSLCGKQGGVILDAGGNRGEKNTRGKKEDWVAYFNERNRHTEGLAIVQHPDNPYYPSPWFTRNYGYFAVNPIWKNQRHWEAGQTYTYRFRAVVFAGSPEEIELEELAESYMNK